MGRWWLPQNLFITSMPQTWTRDPVPLAILLNVFQNSFSSFREAATSSLNKELEPKLFFEESWPYQTGLDFSSISTVSGCFLPTKDALLDWSLPMGIDEIISSFPQLSAQILSGFKIGQPHTIQTIEINGSECINIIRAYPVQRAPALCGVWRRMLVAPYPRLCNARRPRLEPGTFRSQAVRLYRLHQARPSMASFLITQKGILLVEGYFEIAG